LNLPGPSVRDGVCRIGRARQPGRGLPDPGDLRRRADQPGRRRERPEGGRVHGVPGVARAGGAGDPGRPEVHRPGPARLPLGARQPRPRDLGRRVPAGRAAV